MGKIFDYIATLKQKREELKKKQKEANERRANLDTIQFYEDSTQLDNVMTGLSILIADEATNRALAKGGYTHLQACREILRGLGLEQYYEPTNTGDFGQEIADKYHCVFIRAASIDLDSTVLYYPEHCTDFQMEQLKKFNEEIKTFNLNPKNREKNNIIWICYEMDGEEYKKDNLDELIERLEKQKKSSMNP